LVGHTTVLLRKAFLKYYNHGGSSTLSKM
jgi:hypothetical protein